MMVFWSFPITCWASVPEPLNAASPLALPTRGNRFDEWNRFWLVQYLDICLRSSAGGGRMRFLHLESIRNQRPHTAAQTT